MAGDERHWGATGDAGPFAILDATLNIYALANGMDLVKEPTARRLGWYRDGMERGIVLEADADGALTVTALCWKTSDPSTARSAPQREAMRPEDLAVELSTVLEAALEAANAF